MIELARHSVQVTQGYPLLDGRNGLKERKRIRVDLGPGRKGNLFDRGEIRCLVIGVNLAGCRQVAGLERDPQCREVPKFQPRFVAQEN